MFAEFPTITTAPIACTVPVSEKYIPSFTFTLSKERVGLCF
jgi:hypothetical protein